MKETKTKYFLQNGHHLEEIPLNKDNWYFVQMDATIRTAFLSQDLPFPKYVFINSNYKDVGLMQVTIVRANIKNEKEALKWNENKVSVLNALQLAADCNSNDYLTFKFEII